ncbi:hypothetical protein Vretimale_14704 [Volvox reticuliferus]|uniref:Uncharacterized protein n=1 Tax=Volvox reticuliferus TaxID=1737510 RepID=A0A8J4LUZ2_9CHLO|nr:hypothetical protein Vretifemale_15664 [Volvox reticuliferus]GIM11158.1 hypothetical protein Vretimale_14704 [Volvox reticuliferus]
MASLVSAKFGNACFRKPFLGNVSSLLRPGKRCLRSNAATDDPRLAVSSTKTEDLQKGDEKDKEINSLKAHLADVKAHLADVKAQLADAKARLADANAGRYRVSDRDVVVYIFITVFVVAAFIRFMRFLLAGH